jgi:CRISPR-associated protein Csx3
MSPGVQLRPEVQLQVIALRTYERDCQALTINLLKPESLIRPEELLFLEIPPELDLHREVILFGKAPIWLYARLARLCQHTPWVGCYDIRLKAAVLVNSNVPEQQPGDTVPIIYNNAPGSAILIGGPPNSGKSVLSNALRVNLLGKRLEAQIYLHRANWDGEGNHTYETPNRDLAARLTKENKFKLHHHPNADKLIGEYFKYHAQATANIRQVVNLALVDVGGVPDPVKTPVVEQCSHYIVISNHPDKVQTWHDLCSPKLKPLAVIHSVLEERLEVLRTEPFLEIVAGPWERGQPPPVVPDVLLQEVLKLLP